jgi:hypothetical protein
MLPPHVRRLRMEIDVKNKKIKKILGDIKCPQEFCCMETGFDKSCKARDVGLEGYLECLEEDAAVCPFSVPYGSTHFCKCPLRIYICKNLGK